MLLLRMLAVSVVSSIVSVKNAKPYAVKRKITWKNVITFLNHAKLFLQIFDTKNV